MEEDHDVHEAGQGWRFIALISAWYASLWVVVDGWETIPLTDPEIDEMLAAGTSYKRLLRRFRNCVYHYQPSLIDRRHLEFLAAGEGTVWWAYLLHQEFSRFYWGLVEDKAIPSEMRSEVRSRIGSIVGWIPDDIPAARIEELRQLACQAVTLIQDADDPTAKPARELLDAAQQCFLVAEQAQYNWAQLKARVVDRIKQDGCAL